MSADVIVRQVHKGKSVRVEKQIFYNSNGTLVVHFTVPQEYYMVSNRLGETTVYQPAANEVMQMNDPAVSSESELLTVFMSPSYADLNLTRMGFVLDKVERKGEDQIKTYHPTHIADKAIKKVIVVCRDKNPIYCAFYDRDDRLTKKTYYSKYFSLPTMSFPTLVTQIAYDDKGDSVIRKEEYRNIRTKNFASNALFDFKVPANAKRVNPFGK